VNVVAGVNLALAINAATINSQANALAMQYLAGVQMS
jgi:mannose/fructose-specific phosphotransferase system component IIA